MLPLQATHATVSADSAGALGGDPPGWRSYLNMDFVAGTPGPWPTGRVDGAGVQLGAGRYLVSGVARPFAVVLPRGVPSLGDGRISATFTLQGRGRAGLAARVDRAGQQASLYAFWLDDTGTVGSTRWERNAPSLLFSSTQFSKLLVPGGDNTLALQVVGSRLRFTLNGHIVFQNQDTPALPAGAWGLYLQGRAGQGPVSAGYRHVGLVGLPATPPVATVTPSHTPRLIATHTPLPTTTDTPTGTAHPTVTLPALSPTETPRPAPTAPPPLGPLRAWGADRAGQLGDGGTAPFRSTPVQVLGLSGVQAIAAGAYHSLALRADGTVWAWGGNSDGQLGDGSTTGRSTPVQVHGLGGVRAIAAGAYHSLALEQAGTVWAWGANSDGQLGDGSTTSRSTPVQVRGLAGARAIAAGNLFSLALLGTGAN